MKHILLTFGLFLLTTLSFAQDNVASSTEEGALNYDSLFTAAENAYAKYFTLKANPAATQNELYDTLLCCCTDYMKCVEKLDKAQQNGLKDKFRKLRPEVEEAGVYYNGVGNNPKAYKYLKYYLDIPRMPLFDGEQFPRNDNYAAYVFNVAAESHNVRDYESAVSYLQEYIELGAKHHQQTAYKFLAKDLDVLDRLDEEEHVLEEGIMNYSNDIDMLKQAIALHYRRNNNEKAMNLLQKALSLAPNDTSLKLHQAFIDDRNGKFAEALPVYRAFYEQHPEDTNLKKQLAFCYYNLAGSLINQSNTASDAEQFKALRNSATENFNQAIILLEELNRSQTDDQRIPYALSDAYTQVGRTDDATLVKQQAEQSMVDLASNANKKEKMPNFNDWYKPKLEEVLAKWEIRGEFEPAEKYVKRVNPETRKELIAKTRTSLEAEYIQEYSDLYNLQDLTIKPYDPDHETYRIQTRQGDIYIKVPIANNEAQKFKESWNGVKVTSPQFKVDKSGKLLLETATFVTPYGGSYLYDVNVPLEYGKIKISRPEWNDDDLLADVVDNQKPEQQIAQNAEKKEQVDEPINVGASTVDINIPDNKKGTNTKTFALILSNENYKNVEKVPFALNDGKSFMRYCTRVLGIPEENIVSSFNATGNEMIDAIDRIKDMESIYEGMKLLVYYSGHGLPDPSTGEAYLMPVDASPRNIQTGYKLSKFYKELTANNPGSVTVFLDACFSGAKKDGQIMDVSARGVVIKAREEMPQSNMVVFSACTGSETAYPYPNQKHGLFTYFLLKKLQEDKGKTSYKKLAEYIATNVKQNSFRLNGKLQTPTTQSSLSTDVWGEWRLDKE